MNRKMGFCHKYKCSVKSGGFVLGATFSAIILGAVPALAAGPTKSMKAPKANIMKSSAADAGASKKTIGELLQQADRGSGAKLGKKESIAIPEAQDIFSPQKSGSVNLGQVKPPKSNSFYDTGDDKGRYEKYLDEQISQLYKIAQRLRSSPQRGEMWLRLAELYVEKAGLIDYRKQGEFDEKLKEFQAGKIKDRPKLDLADAKEFNKKAIQLYEGFVRDFPKDPKIDQALFFLGYNHYEIGDLAKGTAYYERLSKEFPGSTYVVEAKFALAEYYFENEKWNLARENYGAVLKVKTHRLYNFSLYKYAWCHFRSGNTQEALKWMEFLIRHSRAHSQAASEGKRAVSKLKLESEGLRDIVLMYAEVGDAEKAPSYFKGLAGADAPAYLERLGYFYADKGNPQGARDVFKYLINSNPTAPKAFDYQYQIVKLYGTNKQSRTFREEIFYWISSFGQQGQWAKANAANKDLIDNANKLMETTLRNYVLQQHQTAQNSRAPNAQQSALEGYRIYFTEYKAGPIVADMHFYLGEILYDMGKYEEASTHYRWVVDNGAGTKFHNRAADNILIALERDVPNDQEIAARVGRGADAVAFEPKVARFVEMAKWYLSKFPEAEKALEIEFRVGRLHYQHNQFEQAIPYFRSIIAKHPKSKQAEYSANLLLDAFNLKKDYAGLEKAAGELLALPSIANSKAGADVRGVLEKASFKKGQDLEVAKDYSGSATQFEAFARANPGSALAKIAIFNAAINFERSNQPQKAIAAHVEVLNSTDKEAEKLKPKSRRIIAKLYQDSGMIEEAAGMFRAAALEAGKDPLAPNFYYNAAILFEALGKKADAIQNYESYIGLVRGAEKGDAIFSVANLHRKTQSLSKAIEYYKQFLSVGETNPEKQVEASYYIFDLSRKLNRRKEADEYRKKTLSIQAKHAPEKKGIGAGWAAKIKFEDVQALFSEFKGIKIPSNPKRQQEVVKRKIEMVGQISKALAEIIAFDSPEQLVDALSILGLTNYLMADAIVNTPLPSGLSEEETKQYTAGVKKIAEPFYAKATESMAAAISKASELDSFTDYYLQARDVMARWDPKTYYEGAERTTEMKLGSWMGL